MACHKQQSTQRAKCNEGDKGRNRKLKGAEISVIMRIIWFLYQSEYLLLCNSWELSTVCRARTRKKKDRKNRRVFVPRHAEVMKAVWPGQPSQQAVVTETISAPVWTATMGVGFFFLRQVVFARRPLHSQWHLNAQKGLALETKTTQARWQLLEMGREKAASLLPPLMCEQHIS